MPLVVTYLILVFVAYIVAAIIWEIAVEGRLYDCTDSMPIASFSPPFVHGGEPRNIHDLFFRYGPTTRFMGNDYFIVPPILVYMVWFVFLIMVLVVPVLPIWAKLSWNRQPENISTPFNRRKYGYEDIPAKLN